MKNLFLLLLPFCFSLLSYGQTPKTISYQGVARNATGQPIPNQSIKIKLSLLETATSSNSLYTETHTLTTTSQGLFALQIGAGNVLSGIYANLDWSNGPKFVKTEIDPAGGDNFTLSSTNPLNAVPFALFAQNGDREVTLTGQGATTITGTYPNFVIRSKDSVGTYQAGTGMDLNGNTFAGKVNEPLWNANKLQGKTVDPATPANKDVLKWNGTSWKTGKDSVNTYSAGTGINITPGLNINAKNDDAIWNATKMQGRNISTIQPSKEDFLRYDGSKWVPGKSIPTFTTKQRDSIPTATIPTGFTFYNKNTECLEYYTGNKWLALCGNELMIGDTSQSSDLTELSQTVFRVSSPSGARFGEYLGGSETTGYFKADEHIISTCGSTGGILLFKYNIKTNQIFQLPIPIGLVQDGLYFGQISFVHQDRLNIIGTSYINQQVRRFIYNDNSNQWSIIDITGDVGYNEMNSVSKFGGLVKDNYYYFKNGTSDWSRFNLVTNISEKNIGLINLQVFSNVFNIQKTIPISPTKFLINVTDPNYQANWLFLVDFQNNSQKSIYLPSNSVKFDGLVGLKDDNIILKIDSKLSYLNYPKFIINQSGYINFEGIFQIGKRFYFRKDNDGNCSFDIFEVKL